MKIQKLVGKFKRAWKEEGLKVALGKTFHFIGDVETRKQRKIDAANARSNQADLLVINGCCVLHPTRYRVHHQMEQMREAGISCQSVFFDDLELRMEENYGAFLFFRCECTDEVNKFIDLAKSHGKTVYFDIDDLITDKKYTDMIQFVHDLTPLNRMLFERSCMRTGQTLAKCDIAIATTEVLADELGKVAPRTYVNRNVASKEMVECAERAYETWCVKQEEEKSKSADRIWLGYFSGSLTHNVDFEIIRPALTKLMEEDPRVGLILVGELSESDELKKFSDRIMKMKATDWRNLPNLIVQADINLAPIEDTLFTRAKSEIKWIEAALVRVPTAATKIGAFERMIEDGVTGVLCENTADGWYNGVRSLIEDETRRREIAERAYQYVIANCTTVAKAGEFGEFLKSTGVTCSVRCEAATKKHEK